MEMLSFFRIEKIRSRGHHRVTRRARVWDSESVSESGQGYSRWGLSRTCWGRRANARDEYSSALRAQERTWWVPSRPFFQRISSGLTVRLSGNRLATDFNAQQRSFHLRESWMTGWSALLTLEWYQIFNSLLCHFIFTSIHWCFICLSSSFYLIRKNLTVFISEINPGSLR